MTLTAWALLASRVNPGAAAAARATNICTALAFASSVGSPLACELGPHGIRLVIVRSAGSPDTPAVQQVAKLHAGVTGISLDEYRAGMSSGTLLQRLPMLAEVANAATLLASDRASAMTAAIANVTCGAFIDL